MNPYPYGLLLNCLATAGNKAQKELEKNITIPALTNNVWIAGE
jgi:hypothetical protein